MRTMIEIQDAYIERVLAADAKITARTKGDRFGKTRRAARRDAITKLQLMGFSPEQAAIVLKDAHDVFLLERNARD